MNAEQLMDAVGALAPELVEEALAPVPPAEKRPTAVWVRFAAAAAAFALVAVGVLVAVWRLPAGKNRHAAQPAPETAASADPETAAVSEDRTAAPETPTGAVSYSQTTAEATVPAASAPSAAQPAESVRSQAGEPASSAPTAAAVEQTTGTKAPAAVPETDASGTVATTVPPTAEPERTTAAEAERSLPRQGHGDAGRIAGEKNADGGLWQWIAGLFSGGSPSGAGENLNETAAPEAEEHADCYHPFYQDLAMLETRGTAYRGMPVTEKTQAELESIYGGPFLPAVFPGAVTPPQDASGTVHGVRALPDGTAVAYNEYLYVWTLPDGESRSLTVTADDGGYYPAATIEDLCRTYRAGSATVYWLADTYGGAVRHVAIAARGERAVFTFILVGECGDEAFLETVTAALGC